MAEILEKQATATRLHQLAQHGFLDAPALERALEITGGFPSKTGWQRLINLLLLFLGVALVLAGIIFFFAYNWKAMGKFLKFGLLEAGILLAVLGAWQQGLNRASGKALLLMAAILPGPLMAVYGQVYQTGADPYELFVNWTALILVWVVIGQFAPLWLVWLILLNTSVILYWAQILASDTWTWAGLFDVLALLNLLTLVLWEIGSRRKLDWMHGRWLPRIVLCATLIALVIATQIAIWGDDADPFRLLAPFLYLSIVGGCLWIYQTKQHDLFMVAACLLSGIVVLTTLVIRIVGWEESVLYLLYGLLVVVQAGGAAFWLRFIQQHWEE
jgi:uncharacterized membrane protein